MASIKRRPDGRWRARYRDEVGKEHAKHFPTRAKAQTWLDEVTASIVTGAYVDPKAGSVTFRAYAEAWRGVQVHRDSTRRSIEHQLRLHVYPVLGDRPMRSIRPTDVQAPVRGLADSLEPSTVRVIYGRVAAVFSAAVRDRVIVSTPCVDVKRPNIVPASMLEVVTTEQVLALADTMPARYRALILTGAGTGLRPGELFGLTVDRVDFLRRSIRVDQQLVYRTGKSVSLAPLKTSASYRSVPLADAVGEALAAHLATWPAHAELGLVFTNERGAAIQARPFSVVFARARAACGLPPWVTPHDWRHYYASLLIRSGASVKVVQSRLGHASATTTLDTYGTCFPMRRTAPGAPWTQHSRTTRGLRPPTPGDGLYPWPFAA